MKKLMPESRRRRMLALAIPVAAFAVAGAGLLAVAGGWDLEERAVAPASLVLLFGGILVLARLLQRTGKVAAERTVGERDERARQILDRSHEAYVAMDSEGVVTGWNAAAETTFGWRRDEAIGRTVAELIVPADVRERHTQALAAFDPARQSRMIGRRTELIAVHRDGTEIPVELSVTVVEEPGSGYSFHGFVRDITERRLLEAQQAEMLAAAKESARIDSLTALPNRRGWDEALSRELARARREKSTFCVALLDLDRFKDFNDAHGHGAGDRLLRRAGAAWKLALRQSDLLARYGGEEFAVLLPACGLEEATLVIERLRDVTPEGETVSAGVAEWNGYEAAEALIDRADLALYDAKRGGRDRTAAAA
jgi:diguanylate cyclase (GGDEF)-like protein/PAS domain S-box-containing protein